MQACTYLLSRAAIRDITAAALSMLTLSCMTTSLNTLTIRVGSGSRATISGERAALCSGRELEALPLPLTAALSKGDCPEDVESGAAACALMRAHKYLMRSEIKCRVIHKYNDCWGKGAGLRT